MRNTDQPRLPSFGLITTKYNKNKIANSNLVFQDIKTRYDNVTTSGLDICHVCSIFRFDCKDVPFFKHESLLCLFMLRS